MLQFEKQTIPLSQIRVSENLFGTEVSRSNLVHDRIKRSPSVVPLSIPLTIDH
jgi:hypothetical protein